MTISFEDERITQEQLYEEGPSDLELAVIASVTEDIDGLESRESDYNATEILGELAGRAALTTDPSSFHGADVMPPTPNQYRLARKKSDNEHEQSDNDAKTEPGPASSDKTSETSEASDNVVQFSQQTWRDQANCLGVDPDLFFPDRGDSTKEAKEVCRGCVVREECLEYSVQKVEKFGIWGGLSERERRRIRRQRAQTARNNLSA